jgi:hypothetical protein
MLRLPVSGAEIALRRSDGEDDLILHETAGSPIELGLLLLGRIAQGETRDWAALPVTDFEFLLLSLRAARFGQEMALGFACPHCRDVAEVSFRVADYLASVTPRAVAGVTREPARSGWFRLDGAAFRLPTVGDQAAVAGQPQPARRLAERCLDEIARRPSHRARVDRAMAAMAPELSRPIAGACPSCDAAVQAGFSVARVVVGELRRAAHAVHDDIDLIARAYHWPEAAILALPQERRRAYAERIRRVPTQAA